MMQGKTMILVLIALVLGFGMGIVLRPVILPASQSTIAVTPALATAQTVAPRGTQYFVAHIDEARQVVAGCRDGSVRGGECATAEDAIIKVDATERRRKFLGN